MDKFIENKIIENIYNRFLENKDRFIDKNSNLDQMQKQIAKDFFKRHPASESQVDWNKSATLTYKDFEKIFDDANNTKNALKKASKDNPRLLFEKRDDCKVAGENDKFIFVMPLSYKACVWMDSFDCGGAGAKWCIGYEKNRDYYKKYYEDGYAFILAFNKYPTDVNNDLKYMIQVDPIKLETGDSEDAGKCWTQDDDPNRTLSLLDTDKMSVEKLTGITKEQLIEYGKEYRKIVEEKERKREEKLNIFLHKEVLWKDLPNVVKNSEVSLSIKILDPENVVLGNYSLENTLGNIIKYNSSVRLDFSPSDFSNSKLLDDTESMFYECENLVKMCKLPSNITDANCMFSGCSKLISIDTTSFINVTNTGCMFTSCSSLSSIDTSTFKSVTCANSMFNNCKSLTSIDTSAFINVTYAGYMFAGCTSLISIDAAAFKAVTYTNYMFNNCSKLASIDTTAFTNVTNASSMFSSCSKLASIDIAAFKNVTNASYMFQNCSKLKFISGYPLRKSTNLPYILNRCRALKEIRFPSGTEYLEQYEKLIINNEGGLSSEQIENAKMYSSSPIICFKRD
jgi:hypothetical protein